MYALSDYEYEYGSDLRLTLATVSVRHIWQGYGPNRYPSIVQIVKLKFIFLTNMDVTLGRYGENMD